MQYTLHYTSIFIQSDRAYMGVGFLYNFFPSLLLLLLQPVSNEYLSHQSDYVGLRETDSKEQVRSGRNVPATPHCRRHGLSAAYA